MTKEDFDMYTGMLHCNTCGKLVPKIHIDHKKVHKNGDILRCNVCEWIKRHNGIPKIDNFSDEEIIAFLHFTLYTKYESVLKLTLSFVCTSINKVSLSPR